MGKIKWDIEDMLSVGENIIYQCELEDEEENAMISIYLTNFRVIWINGEFVDCRFLKYVSKCGVFAGYEEYSESADIGTGEYGLYFGEVEGYVTFLFYSQDVLKEFYAELSRTIIEQL